MENTNDKMEDITYTNSSNGKKAVVVDLLNTLLRNLSAQEAGIHLTASQVEQRMKRYIKRLICAAQEKNVHDVVVVGKNLPIVGQSHHTHFAEIVFTMLTQWQAEHYYLIMHEGGVCTKLTILWVTNDPNKGRDDAMTYWAFNYLRSRGYETIRLSRDQGRDALTFQNTVFGVHEIECFNIVDNLLEGCTMPNTETLAQRIQNIMANFTKTPCRTISGTDFTPDQILEAVHTRLDQTAFVQAHDWTFSSSDEDDKMDVYAL